MAPGSADADLSQAHRTFVRAASSGTGESSSGCPVQEGAASPSPGTTAAAASAGCPVSGNTGSTGSTGSTGTQEGKSAQALNPLNLMPQVPNQPTTSQSTALSTQRVSSSIPMGAPPDKTPKHQQPGADVWTYPSEQMFFNAMKRKGWNPNEEDMPAVVAIHNTVNERAWREVLAYESLHASSCNNPRLQRFMGRPTDYSPKARLLNFLGYKLPFDRHDWIVDRCGQEVRYLIDFYNAVPTAPGVPAGMYLDARPALDSFGAAWDRLRLQFSWLSSGRWRQE